MIMASRVIKAQFFLYLALIKYLMIILPNTIAASGFPTSLPGCPGKCGDITIPYPFGTGPGCYRDGFDVKCNTSTTPPKPFFRETNITLLDININSAEARVLNYIGYDCYKNKTKQKNENRSRPSQDITTAKAFPFSNKSNKFTAIGCYNFAYIFGNLGNHSYVSGCLSFCESLNKTTGDGGPCDGFGCCQTAIPEGLNNYEVSWGFRRNPFWKFKPWSYAELVEEDSYKFNVEDLNGFGFYERNKEYVPIVLDWAVRENGTCLASHEENSPKPTCQSNHSRCDNTTNGEEYICKCLPRYEGNPYLPDGCPDINECEFEEVCKDGTCFNTKGSYECDCPIGRKLDSKTGHCVEKFRYVVTYNCFKITSDQIRSYSTTPISEIEGPVTVKTI